MTSRSERHERKLERHALSRRCRADQRGIKPLILVPYVLLGITPVN